MSESTRITNFPISFFAVVMGLLGFTIATQKLEGLLSLGDTTSTVFLGVALAVFALLTLAYALKAVRHWGLVVAEFNDPVRLSFFPTFSISLLLTSIALLPISNTISFVLWVIGSVVHLMLTLAVLSIWVQHEKFEITHMNPAWFIPVVGNILVPLAGVEHAPTEISWFFFSVGLVFWIVLQTLFFYRVFFHRPLPERLLPTFFILLAPPAVGFIAYIKLSGRVDAFANVLYYFAVFTFLFLLVQLRMLRKARFFLSWWAYSFPMAALTIASVLMYKQTDGRFFYVLAFVAFAVLVAVILTLVALTARSVWKRQVCVED